MKIYFVSGNEQKRNEVVNYFINSRLEIEAVDLKINEIQCTDVITIIRDKVKKAFLALKRPVFVEQTGLYIDDFGGLPGGLTEIMWDTLQAEKFCDFFGRRQNVNAKALTVAGYCDGKNIETFEETFYGKIADAPQGKCRIGWDCIFIPNGFQETISNLKEKNAASPMRKPVMEKLEKYLLEEDV